MDRMAAANPYAAELGERLPLDVLAETPSYLETVMGAWSPDRFERSYAPGKWSARLILVHLAQTELALTTRARFALGEDGYTAQPFSQDAWLPFDSGLDAGTALAAFVGMRRMNVSMWRGLSAGQLDRAFTHPEFGLITVGWIMNQMAGHDLHHRRQIQGI